MRNAGYKISIGVLLFVVILQWAVIDNIRRPKKEIIKPKAAQAVKGKIAIVLDDWGYNLGNLLVIEQIKYPLTCSVLPNLSYSKLIAEELNGRGFQIILHLPMEPEEKYRLEKDTLLVSMNEAEMKAIIERGLSSIVYARGVSNHMGSRASADAKTMEAIFRELKRRHLFFLDSFVSSKSVGAQTAAKIGLGFAKRDIFLDNQEEASYIKRQLYKLKHKAGLKGQAIGIGHARRKTLEVLKEVMPEIEKEGYRFVFLSELIR